MMFIWRYCSVHCLVPYRLVSSEGIILVYSVRYGSGFLGFVSCGLCHTSWCLWIIMHMLQSCFSRVWVAVRLPQCQWSNPGRYGLNWPLFNSTKHNKGQNEIGFVSNKEAEVYEYTSRQTQQENADLVNTGPKQTLFYWNTHRYSIDKWCKINKSCLIQGMVNKTYQNGLWLWSKKLPTSAPLKMT